MASALYTLNWTQYQGLPAGHSRLFGPFNVTETGIAVITNITAYCGNPSPAQSNSIVLVSVYATSNQPTLWAYHSGTTESVNPIFVDWEGRLVFDPVVPDPNFVPIFMVANTADPLLGGGTWDFSVSGWWLVGGPAQETSSG